MPWILRTEQKEIDKKHHEKAIELDAKMSSLDKKLGENKAVSSDDLAKLLAEFYAHERAKEDEKPGGIPKSRRQKPPINMISEEQRLENIQKSQLLLRKNISEEYFKGKRGAPPFNGKPPLLSDYQMFRMWFRDIDHWCTLNVGQPEYYILTEILRVLELGQSSDKLCASRIRKALNVYYLELCDISFNALGVVAKIRRDYDLESKEHKKRLENLWLTKPYVAPVHGQTCIEVFREIRELAVALSFHDVKKDFHDVVTCFISTRFMQETSSDFRRAIINLAEDTESLDDIEDRIIRHQIVDRAQRGTIAVPGLKPGLETKMKMIPVGLNSSKGSGKIDVLEEKSFM